MEITTQVLQELPLDDFLLLCRDSFVAQNEDAEKLLSDEILLDLSEHAPVKYLGMLALMAEEELKKAAANNQGGVAFDGLMEDYIRTRRSYFEGLFKPVCFTERGMKWMAPECQANDILVKFLDGGKKELKLVLEAAKMQPDLAQVMKVWLSCLK